MKIFKKKKAYNQFERRRSEDCKEIKLSFDIEAKPKQSVRGGKNGFYKDPKVKQYENKLIILAKKQLTGVRLSGPVYYEAVYTFTLPKKAPKWVKDKIEASETVYKSTKPDLTDNLNKGIIDAITPLFMDDDSRIAHCHMTKVYGKENRIDVAFIELSL